MGEQAGIISQSKWDLIIKSQKELENNAVKDGWAKSMLWIIGINGPKKMMKNSSKNRRNSAPNGIKLLNAFPEGIRFSNI